MAGIYKYPGAFGRVQSTFFNPIYFGMYINLAMVIILYLINAFKGTPYYIKKWLLNTMFIIATAILALTFTRSAYIVAILNIGLIYLLNFNHLKYLLKKSLIVIILSVIVVLNIPGAYSTMKSAILAYLPKIEESELANDNDISLDEVDASITSRKEFYKAAYNAYNDNKILGVGFGSYEDFMKKDNNTEKYFSTRFGFPHNNYIHILVEAGTIAFIFLMISISIVIKKAFVLYWKSRNYEMMGGIIIANIISLLLIAFYESLTYDSQLFMLEVLFTAIAINYVSSLSNKKTSLYQ